MFETRYMCFFMFSLSVTNNIHIIIIVIVTSIPNIVRVIKSRRLRWAGHVARMEEGRSAFKILTGKPT